MGSTETAFRFHIVLKINGNKRDSKTEWEDARNKITRNCAIQAFLGAVGSNIPWSLVPERKREQERGINTAFTILVEMAGAQTVRSYVRKIENNKLTDPPILAEDVDKVRSIIAYYDSLTMDNNTKDIDLLKLLEEIKFDSTGKNNLSNDVTEYFEKISKNQEDMQPQHRMSNFQSVKMCSGHLSRFIPSLRGPLSNLDLLSITFEELRIAVDAICQTMEVHGGHHYDNDVSSNSTALSSRPEEMITISPSRLKDAMMTVVKQSRNSARSDFRGNSYRSDSQYGNDRRRETSMSAGR